MTKIVSPDKASDRRSGIGARAIPIVVLIRRYEENESNHQISSGIPLILA